jgi:ornithine carbamoyltransferase
MRHFLTLKDFTKDEILEIIDLGLHIKSELKSGIKKPYLEKQTLAMIFEKSSTRTRVSFEVGMYQLGGHALFLSNRDIQIGQRRADQRYSQSHLFHVRHGNDQNI